MVLIFVIVVLGALVSATVRMGRAAFARGASQWPGYIDRRVERVRVGEGAFRDQSATNAEDRVVPPGIPSALKAAALAALVVGSPTFVIASVIFAIISGRVFVASLGLSAAALARGIAMFAGALLWLTSTLASWRGAVAAIERRTDTALGALRLASVAQLLSMLSLGYVAITKVGLHAMSLTEWLVVAWPLIALVPMTVAWRTVSRFADEMRGHGLGVVVTEGGVRVDPTRGDASTAPVDIATETSPERKQSRR